MKNKINRWSKLEAKQQTQQYDLGGWLKQNAGTIGSVVGAGIGTLIAPGIGTSIGASLGGQVGGLAGNIGDGKTNIARLNQEKQMQTQQALLAMPKSGQGLSQGQLAYGGYLTPSLLAKSGIHIAPSKKGTFTAQATKMGMSVQAEGGYMAKGGYTNPLSMPNNGLFSFQGGGTHEQNPLGGIPIGKSLQGEQRTVEDKEAAFTFTGEKKGTNGKYIFSHRLILKK